MPFYPKNGKRGQKWAEQLEKINFFVYCSKLIFLIFCMKLETIKGYKLTLKPFLRKFLILQILVISGHFWLKNRVSCILLNIASLDFFDIKGYKLTLNLYFGKILIQSKFWFKWSQNSLEYSFCSFLQKQSILSVSYHI